MATDGFVHLHVHSHFSLLDGAASTKGLVACAKEHGMDSLAITDHGNMFGAVDFYTEAKKADVKPILGLEAYISPTHRTDRSMGNQQTASYHLVLLAMNHAGWGNLKKLASRSFLEGFYYKPRIDRELLSELNEGLICSTACLGGEVPNALLRGDYDAAKRIAGEYLDIFGRDRFFIEIQNQGIDDQTRINPDLVRLSRELDVGLVGTNDVHFLRREDKPSHEVLCCISTGKTLEDTKQAIREGRSHMEYPELLYLRPPAEMREAFKAFPGASDNTLKIAEMCDLSLDFSTEYLPVFKVPTDQTDDEYLASIAWEGLAERFGEGGVNCNEDGSAKEIPQEYRERMEWELKVIRDKRYSSYFLIVNDFVEYARKNSIPSAPRGSGVATLLGYALKIAEVDPIEYGLLFERFTDPQREEAPDIDIDICQEGRGKLIQYVRDKYGHVAQIITYGTLKARAVLRDVGRVLNVPIGEVNAICKLVPNELKMTLDKALAKEPDFRKLYESDPRVKAMVEHGRKLEGLCRHAGVHAAGVIVADVPLETIVPLYKQGSDNEDVITQWDGPTCEKAGLMKMDFLGLRTLTIIQRTREMVAKRTGQDVDPERVPLDDDAVYKLFRDGHTDCVFQFESDGMKNILRQMGPTQINDLIAANAMYRPGPMELIPSYCARKHGTEVIPSVHKLVDDLLAETYGIMAYQEQVMQVLNRLGKLPLNRALTLIKAISKKKEKDIAAEKPNFMAGAIENGISETEANDLFDLILKFAGYGFNKAHSTRYAIVAYQTAYFKTYYPKDFMAATLTFECGDTDKVVQYMEEARRMKIDVLPPDINACGDAFAVDGDAVRFGLSAVKGVGHSAVEAIVAAREECGRFTDLFHFCEFVDARSVNKGAIEALIKCGAFDALGANRAAMTKVVEKAVALGNKAADDRKSGQMSFFGEGGFLGETRETTKAQFPSVAPWSKAELLQAEKETLGFYVSSHPLVEYAREMAGLSYPGGLDLGRLVQDTARYPHDTRIRVGCMIQQIRQTVTKSKGEKMAMLTLEDTTGKCEAVAFPRTYALIAEHLYADHMVFITGSVDHSRDRVQIIVDEVVPLIDASERYTKSMTVVFPPAADDTFAEKLKALLAAHPGSSAVHLEIRPSCRPDIAVMVQASQSLHVKPTRELLLGLEALLDQQQQYIRLTPTRVSAGQTRRKWNGQKNATGQNGKASAAVTRFN